MRVSRYTKWAVVAGAVFALSAGGALAGTSSVTPLGSWVGKLHEYANPFDPDLNRSASESTMTSAPGWSVGAALERVVNRVDGWDGFAGGARLSKGGESVPGSATWMQFQAPSAFEAKTLVVSQGVWGGFSGAMPFEVRLNGGAPVVTGPGSPGYQTMQIVHTSGSYDTVRIDFPETAIYAGTGYADMAEVAIFPDKLVPLAVTATASHTTWGSPTSLVDLTDYNGWSYHVGDPAHVTIDFALDGTQAVDAILLYSYQNSDAAFTIKDDTGTPIADVTMTIGPAGWMLPIQFDEPLMTSKLTFDWGTVSPGVNFREVIIMQKVEEPPVALIPEPATAVLLTAGLGLLFRRRAKR